MRGFEDKSDKGWFGFGKKTPAKPVSGHEAHEGPHLDVEEPEEKPRPKKDLPADKPAEKEPPRKKPVPTEERETDGPSTDDDDTDDKDDTSPLHVAAGIGELPRARPPSPSPRHIRPRRSHVPTRMVCAAGDLDTVKDLLGKGEDVLITDKNMWHPLHEASRGGHVDIVKHLIENGADLGATTKGGGTALWWAKQTHEADHPVIAFLESIGAPDWAEEEL